MNAAAIVLATAVAVVPAPAGAQQDSAECSLAEDALSDYDHARFARKRTFGGDSRASR